MPIVDQLSCGFAKVVVGSILSSKLNPDVVDGSTNVNEVITAVVSFFFFFRKRFHTQHKAQKAQKAKRRLGKSTKTQMSE